MGDAETVLERIGALRPACKSSSRACWKHPMCLLYVYRRARKKDPKERKPTVIRHVQAMIGRADEFEALYLSGKRKEGVPVGLKNLGATCYLGTLVQVLFQNRTLRDCILQTPATSGILSSVNQLFQSLYWSAQQSVSPSRLIDVLKVNPREQQDVQEFNKLFLDILFHELSIHSSSFRTDMFTGQLVHETQCSGCLGSSQMVESFLEIAVPVQRITSLIEALGSLFVPESLQGSNQYRCSACGTKQDAQRYTRTQHLPDVVNLQLLRFEYDIHAHRKTKTHENIQIPAVLTAHDLGHTSDDTFELHAIIHHLGESAYSGHYVADLQTEEGWFHFDDEDVTAFTVSDITPSKTAYMLVYRRSDVPHSNTCHKQPTAVIRAENETFLKSKQEADHVHDQVSLFLETRFRNIDSFMSLYHSSPFHVLSTPAAFCFVDTTWLEAWFSAQRLSDAEHTCVVTDDDIADALDSRCPGNDLKLQTCSHAGTRFPVTTLTRFKIIPVEALALLRGHPYLPIVDSLCRECLVWESEQEMKRKVLKDRGEALITSIRLNAGNDSVWVSKAGIKGLIPQLKKQRMEFVSEEPRQQLEWICGVLNQGLHCIHGRLSLFVQERQCVAFEAAMEMIRFSLECSCFSHTMIDTKELKERFLSCSEELCVDCIAFEKQTIKRKRDDDNLRAVIQAVCDSLFDPAYVEFPHPHLPLLYNEPFFLVPFQWMSSLKSFIDGGATPSTQIPTKDLLCSLHSKLKFNPLPKPSCPENENGESSGLMCAVPHQAWKVIRFHFDLDGPEISVEYIDTSKQGKQSQRWDSRAMKTSPSLCFDCMRFRQETELQAELCFEDEPITVELRKNAPSGAELGGWNTAAVSRTSLSRKRRAATKTRTSKRFTIFASSSMPLYTFQLGIYQETDISPQLQLLYINSTTAIPMARLQHSLFDLGVKRSTTVYVVEADGDLWDEDADQHFEVALGSSEILPEGGFLGSALVYKAP